MPKGAPRLSSFQRRPWIGADAEWAGEGGWRPPGAGHLLERAAGGRFMLAGLFLAHGPPENLALHLPGAVLVAGDGGDAPAVEGDGHGGTVARLPKTPPSVLDV